MIKLIYPDGHEVKLQGIDSYTTNSDDTIDFFIGTSVRATVCKMPGLLVVDDGEEGTK